MRLTWILSIVLALSVSPLCSASIHGVAGETPPPGGGTPAPGPTLDDYFMTPFPDESGNGDVSFVDSPLGNVFFSPISLRINSNSDWTNWDPTDPTDVHEYDGKVYYTAQTLQPSSMRLTLPSDTVAFYFYASANHTSPQYVRATASGTSGIDPLTQESLTQESLTQQGNALGGARYYGFYVDSGESLTTIDLEVVQAPDYNTLVEAGFILGAFGIAKRGYPSPGSPVTLTDLGTGTTISFQKVDQSGATTVTVSDHAQTPVPPPGFMVGTPATIFDISTAAVFQGNITIGINYDPTDFVNESELELFHFDENKGIWFRITTSLDMANNMIYGTVESLSAFAVFQLDPTNPNHPPVANAGPDQIVDGTSPAGALVTLDGSKSTDPDSAPDTNLDIWVFDWYEGDILLGSGETLPWTFAPGVHTVTLEVTDYFGETDDDQVIITVEDTTPPRITVNIENAKVCWDHSDIHVEGKLYLPQGFWMNNLNPVGSTVIELAGAEVTNQSVGFEIAGKKDDKWEYKDKDNLYGNLKEFKIDWKGAKFDYKGDDKFHIHTPFIGTETTLCIHTGDVSGAFAVSIDGTTIYYDAQRNITTDPPDVDYDPQKDDNTRVRFTLPFELTSEMMIGVSGAIQHTIDVANYYEEGFVKFKIVSAFDSGSFSDGSATSPDELECVISLGDMIAGSDLIDAWTNKDDKHWEYK